MAKSISTVDEATHKPLTLILQWLTYAFWGLCGLATVALSGVTLAYFIYPAGSSDVATGIAYPLAAVVVLLTIALIVDYFYTKVEPAKKTGAASIILVVHAVLFALATIGSFVIAAFALVSMGISVDENNYASLTMLFTALISLVIFAALTARTILTGHLKHTRKISWTILLVVVLSMVIASLGGPVSYSNATKNDRRIEQHLPSLVSQISNYTSEHSKLPDQLNQLSTDSENLKSFINSGLVTYKPNTKPVQEASTDNPKSNYGADQHYYQLCVIFQAEKKDPYGSSSYPSKDGIEKDANDYAPYLYRAMSHPKGDYCYKLIALGPYDDYPTPSPMPYEESFF